MSDVEGTADKRQVFVVHGRNSQARADIFSFLRAIGLQPIEWSQATKMTGKGTPFIGEILDAAFQRAAAVIVLLSGDDEARLRSAFRKADDADFESTLTPQARPNVLFEAGMAFGRYPERTILVQLGTLREFSDVAGRHAVRLSNSTQQRQELAQRLATAGCDVDLTGTDWHNVGDFEAAAEPFGENEGDDAPDESANDKTGIHPDAVEILKLAGAKIGWVSRKSIQGTLQMNENRFRHFLDVLRDDGLIKYDASDVMLEPIGRKFVVEKDII